MAGYSVSSAGDVDGDGLDDVLIGAFTSSPQAREMAGTVYCVLGGSKKKGIFDLSDLNGFDGFTMYGEHSGDGAGFDVAAAADFNNDGIDDIIVSSVFQKGFASDKGGNAYVQGTNNNAHWSICNAHACPFASELLSGQSKAPVSI